MTLKDIENAGYRVFGAYGEDLKDFSHMHQIYDGFAYHGIIEVDGKKKFFRVTLIEDCPLYNVRIRIKTIGDLKAAISEYFPVDSRDTHYYDMYNVEIRATYRVESFIYGIVKDYSNDLNPLFRIANLVPVCVPSGTFTLSLLPSTIGISSSAPNVACVIVTGISHKTLFPFLVYMLCLFILTVIYKSPFCPPFSPDSPSPLNTIV